MVEVDINASESVVVMDRISKGLIVVVLICAAFFVLYLFEPFSEKTVWLNTNKTVSWAAWAEAVKALVPLVASSFFFFMLFTKSILQSARKSVFFITIGTFLCALGAAIEMMQRINGVDATAYNPAFAAYFIGGFFIFLSIVSFQHRLGVSLKPAQRLAFVSVLTVLCMASIFIIVSPYYMSPDTVQIEFVLSDVVAQVLYAVMVLLNFAVALRLSMIFSSGKMGRPFRIIAAGIFCITVYEYIVWLPTTQIDVFSHLNVLWIACFLLGMVGVYDLSYK